MEKVKIFCCGGTIDKVYFDALSSYQVGKPAAADILSRARAMSAKSAKSQKTAESIHSIHSILRKDSLEMTAADRARVAARLKKDAARRLVLTHGTDTMCATAEFLAAAKLQKTIVLTGAFSPAVFRETDADFNLGFALAAAALLPAGVYVAMQGRIFPAGAVKKNRKAGRFETVKKSRRAG